MTYCKLLLSNYWTTATLTALSEATALPVEFSQTPERTQVYRSLSQTADQYILCDLGVSRECDYAAIANLVKQNSGAVKLYEGGTGGSPGAYTLVATFPSQSSDTRLSAVSFTSTSARHWKIEWTNAVPATPAYVEAGYIGLGASLLGTETICMPEVSFDRIDPSVAQMSVDGQKSFTLRTGFYAGSLSFDFILEAEASSFHQAWRTVGKRVSFFFALDTDLSNQQWLMRFGGELRFSRRGGSTPIYTVSFDWEESR